MKIITIDRQYGSGGRKVGMSIAKKANIPYYDTELIFEASKRFGLDTSLMQSYDETKQTVFVDDIGWMASLNLYVDHVNPYEIYGAIANTIKMLAAQGPAVFIGRCADTILGETYPITKVFIYSSDVEKKLEQIQEENPENRKNLESFMKKKDKQRKAYYEFFTSKTWGEKNNYNLMLNTAFYPYELCADIILSACQN